MIKKLLHGLVLVVSMTLAMTSLSIQTSRAADASHFQEEEKLFWCVPRAYSLDGENKILEQIAVADADIRPILFQAWLESQPTFDTLVSSRFMEIALEAEFGSRSDLVVKWTEDVMIYVISEGGANPLESELRALVKELNVYIGSIEIAITNDAAKANFFLYLGSRENYGRLVNSKEYMSNDGLFSCSVNRKSNVIKSCRAWISTDQAKSYAGRRHLLREEITQALGLMQDSPCHTNSIFFGKPSLVQNYSGLDIALIYLLYQDWMEPGMTGKEVFRAIIEPPLTFSQ